MSLTKTLGDGTTIEIITDYQGPTGLKGDKGDVGMNWRGAYDNNTAYVIDDGVSYDGSSYICILDTTGNLPTNTTYWDLIAQKSDMTKSTYDPNGIEADVFNQDNMVSGNTNVNYTKTESNKLSGIEPNAQVNTVNSVAGKTGAVSLVKADVGLGNVDNTSDLAKPISTATQNALNTKANLSGGNTFTGDQTINGNVLIGATNTSAEIIAEQPNIDNKHSGFFAKLSDGSKGIYLNQNSSTYSWGLEQGYTKSLSGYGGGNFVIQNSTTDTSNGDIIFGVGGDPAEEALRINYDKEIIFQKNNKARETLGLPKFDEGVISDLDAFKETGWRICSNDATSNPNNDYNWVFTKMINNNYGQQDVYSRTARRHYRRFLDDGTWSEWHLVEDTNVFNIDDNGNIGIGTTNQRAKLEIGGNGEGIILTSSGGNSYKITVDDSGNLTTTAV